MWMYSLQNAFYDIQLPYFIFDNITSSSWEDISRASPRQASNLLKTLVLCLGRILSLYEAKYLGQIMRQTFSLNRGTMFGTK